MVYRQYLTTVPTQEIPADGSHILRGSVGVPCGGRIKQL